MSEVWSPWCQRPDSLVAPGRLDPTGRDGPTRGQARGPHWRQVAAGWYVPSSATLCVEQRILEAAARLPRHSAVTGWASLRWRGAASFDGRADGGRTVRPVPLMIASRLRPDPRVELHREHTPPHDRELVADVMCTSVRRALFDEMRWAPSLRSAVVAADMAMAAGLLTPDEFPAIDYWFTARTGIPRVRDALALARPGSASPQESRLRLVWTVDANLPEPLLNTPVYDLRGTLLGIPDLFDPVAGLVGEYDGEYHEAPDQRPRDAAREERFRDHGLEYVAVVRGDLANYSVVAARLRRARARARFEAPEHRRWTLDAAPLRYSGSFST